MQRWYYKIFKVLFILGITAYISFSLSTTVHAQTVSGAFGILGDSNSDEFRADDNRGGTYASVTFNWVEQLVKSRQLNFGPWGTWGGSRRTGYQYNFARSAATTSSLSSQYPGLAEFVQNDTVKYVFINIGFNDFAQYNATNGYPPIYNGTLTGTALDAKIQKMILDMETAVNAIYSIGKAKIMVFGIPNPENNPEVVKQFPDPVKRKLVTDALNRVNNGFKNIAQTRNIIYFDPEVEFNQIIFQYVPLGYIPIGNERILFTPGNEPHHVLLGDGIHIGTVVSGIYANAVIKKINTVWGTGIALMTDQEILATAGILANLSPTPTSKISQTPPPVTVSPTIGGCSLKSQGDADCSGVINLVDFEIWRKEYMQTLNTKTADFNANGSVDLIDFEIWRKSYLK